MKKRYPIVIEPDYSAQLCREPSAEDKCNEVPPEFISEFSENKNCVGLTLKVLNSINPDKWPDWWRHLQADDRHHNWEVRVSFYLGNGALDLPAYLGTVTGPDGVSHQLADKLSSAEPSPMREIVGKTCALASGAINGGTVEL